MIIDKVVVTEYRTNCYIISIGNECLVIDPGGSIDEIKKVIGRKNILGALVTHSHVDHIGATSYFDKVYSFNNLSEGKHQIGPFNFEVIYTPGHRFDCVTYYFEKEKVMFTGDFLFYDTVGRTDLDGSSKEKMKKSIEKIKKYPDCNIYPGHGWYTSLRREKERNKYFL